MSALFWFISGVLAGVMGTMVAIPLWRASTRALERPAARYALVGVAGIAVFALSAALIYLAIGSPNALNRRAAAVAAPQEGAGQSGQGGKPQSMEAATAGLEARLARDGGSAEDWLLLAQSYEFLGKTDDAKRARARAASAGAKSAATSSTSSASASPPPDLAPNASPSELEGRVKSNPRDSQSWLALASLHRGRREYDQAKAAYSKVIGLNGMTSEAWADYADTLGSLSGGALGAEAGRAISRALALDPTNAKALWLQASRAHQEHRYADALADWKRLQAMLPSDSPDAQLVDANIVEASQLAGLPAQSPSAALSPASAVGSNTEVSGTVSIDDRLAERVGKDATLFIYAKAVDSPGPPLAVLRTTAAGWPISFHLDDSMAMIPSRRLSQFQKVVVEARISRSGQAQPAAGDLYVTSDVLRPGAAKRLALVINREIG